MPRGNGTGPYGLGPMTGRAAGFCVGNTVPGFYCRWGRDNGYGGWRQRRFNTKDFPVWSFANRYETETANQDFNKKETITYLKSQQKTMQKSLEELEKQINSLENIDQEEENK